MPHNDKTDKNNIAATEIEKPAVDTGRRNLMATAAAAGVLTPLMSMLAHAKSSGMDERVPELKAPFPDYDMEIKGKYVELNDSTLYIQESGAGFPMLMIPCNIFSVAESWKEVQQRLPKHRCVAVDLPGIGRATQKPNFHYSLTSNADTLIALMDKMGIEQADLLGHARGASVGLIMAEKYPDRVRTLLLNAPVLYDYWPVLEVAGMGSLKHHMEKIREMMPILLPTFTALLTLMMRVAVYKQGVMTDARLRRNIGHFMTNEGAERLIRICGDGNTEEVNGIDVGKLKQPALVVWGEFDNYFRHEIGERFVAEHQDAEFYLVPNSGLLTIDEDPQELAGAVLRFLAKRGYVT